MTGTMTIEEVNNAGVGNVLIMLENDFMGIALAWRRVGASKTSWQQVIPNGSGWTAAGGSRRPGQDFLTITKMLRAGRRFVVAAAA